MRIHKLLPILLALGAYPALAAEDHDHDHEHADHAKGNLLEQLGYAMMTVEDQTIAGKSVVTLPVQSLFDEKGKIFVLAQDEKNPDNFIRWEVEIGPNDGQFVEVKNGVFPGDKIVIRMADLVAYRQSTGAGYKTDGALTNATVTPPQPATPATANTPAPAPAPAIKVANTPAPAPAKPAVEKPSEKKVGNYEIQIGAFSKEESAKKIADQLKANYGKAGVLVSQSKGRPLYLVRVGDFTSFRTARDTKEKLATAGYPEAFVVSTN